MAIENTQVGQTARRDAGAVQRAAQRQTVFGEFPVLPHGLLSVEPASAACAASAPILSAPRAAAADPSASAAQLALLVRGVPQAPLRLGGATAVSAVGTGSGLRGAKFSVKLSLASPCGPAATTPRLMTTNTTPATLSCFCVPTVDELMVATECRFALDVFIVAQQDYPIC